MPIRTNKSSALGFFTGMLSSIFGKSKYKPTTTDLQQADFKTSTQHLGVRFTDKIRNVFRFKWLGRHRF